MELRETRASHKSDRSAADIVLGEKSTLMAPLQLSILLEIPDFPKFNVLVVLEEQNFKSNFQLWVPQLFQNIFKIN